jgi:DNA polymerase alpha subunit B
VASKIYDGVPLPKVTSTADSLLQFQHGNGCMEGRPLSVVVAAGPFTTSDNLDYEPLQELVSHLLLEAPDVVILTGPFVDLLHPQVLSGDLNLPLEDGSSMAVTPDVLFSNRVGGLLETLYDDYHRSSPDGSELNTQFILVPSVDDVVSDGGAVFPQPPLADRNKILSPSQAKELNGLEIGTLGLNHVEEIGRSDVSVSSSKKKRVHCFSNPCTVQVNEVVFGITSTDVVQHICADETNARLSEKRLLKISKHLLQQECYYPIFPPNISVDYAHRAQTVMPCTPDVLIVPSKLNPFCSPVDGNGKQKCLVMNPGWLSKGTTGGTYASMKIHPMKREKLEEMDSKIEVDHNVQDRAEVVIMRI